MAPWSGLTIRAASSVFLAALGCLAQAGEFVDPRTGIPVRYEIDAQTFPDSWRCGDIRAEAMPLASYEVLRSKRIAVTALSVYPVGLLKHNLRAVYFADTLTFYGLSYGGTNSYDTVYIANRGATQGFTDNFLLRTFHHEFSSILLRNYPAQFDSAAWRAANRSAYGTGGIDALKNGRCDTKYEAKYNVDGFLNQYGTSSLEEDVNTFAEAMFSGDRAFWTLADRFPRIKDKKDVLVKFYRALDPSLTEDYVRSLATSPKVN